MTSCASMYPTTGRERNNSLSHVIPFLTLPEIMVLLSKYQYQWQILEQPKWHIGLVDWYGTPTGRTNMPSFFSQGSVIESILRHSGKKCEISRESERSWEMPRSSEAPVLTMFRNQIGAQYGRASNVSYAWIYFFKVPSMAPVLDTSSPVHSIPCQYTCLAAKSRIHWIDLISLKTKELIMKKLL